MADNSQQPQSPQNLRKWDNRYIERRYLRSDRLEGVNAHVAPPGMFQEPRTGRSVDVVRRYGDPVTPETPLEERNRRIRARYLVRRPNDSYNENYPPSNANNPAAPSQSMMHVNVDDNVDIQIHGSPSQNVEVVVGPNDNNQNGSALQQDQPPAHFSPFGELHRQMRENRNNPNASFGYSPRNQPQAPQRTPGRRSPRVTPENFQPAIQNTSTPRRQPLREDFPQQPSAARRLFNDSNVGVDVNDEQPSVLQININTPNRTRPIPANDVLNNSARQPFRTPENVPIRGCGCPGVQRGSGGDPRRRLSNQQQIGTPMRQPGPRADVEDAVKEAIRRVHIGLTVEDIADIVEIHEIEAAGTKLQRLAREKDDRLQVRTDKRQAELMQMKLDYHATAMNRIAAELEDQAVLARKIISRLEQASINMPCPGQAPNNMSPPQFNNNTFNNDADDLLMDDPHGETEDEEDDYD